MDKKHGVSAFRLSGSTSRVITGGFLFAGTLPGEGGDGVVGSRKGRKAKGSGRGKKRGKSARRR